MPPYPSCLQQEEKGQGPPNYSYGFGWQYFRLSPFHHLVGKHLEGLQWARLDLSGISEQTKEKTHPVFVSQVPSM